MKVDYRKIPLDQEAPRGQVINLDTGLSVGYVCFFDEETGEWERYVKSDGAFVLASNGRVLTEKGVNRIKFFPNGVAETN